jgi:hypothetical protein
MTYTKEVYKIDKDGKKTVEMKECHPQRLPERCRYVAPYWWQAFQNVSQYEKKRELQEVHKLVADNRVSKGLRIYRGKKIIHNVVTKVNRGDVHATVESEDGKEMYTVILKNYLAEKPPQFTHEREQYLADLYVDCTCKDHVMGHYRSNASMMCGHICAVIWYLIDNFNMEKIFISPEERIVGWEKSSVDELETDIQALPLVLFTQHINILLMKKYRGMSPALALSIHKVDNKTHREESKAQWLTYTEVGDVERLIKGISKAYRAMAKHGGIDDESMDITLALLTGINVESLKFKTKKPEKKPWYKFWK